MENLKIRDILINDAKYFLDICNNPKFYFWKQLPRTIKEEQSWIKKQAKLKKQNKEIHYSILYDNDIVGVIGIKIYQHRTYCGELGYIIDPKLQGKGIASKAVSLLEKKIIKKLGLKRLEIITTKKNIVSQKVATNNGYKKEGLMRGIFMMEDGTMQDAYLFAKTF